MYGILGLRSGRARRARNRHGRRGISSRLRELAEVRRSRRERWQTLGRVLPIFLVEAFHLVQDTSETSEITPRKNAFRLGRAAYCAANISAHLAIWPSVDSVAPADLFQGCQTDAETFRYLLLGESEILTEFFNRHISWTSHDDAAI